MHIELLIDAVDHQGLTISKSYHHMLQGFIFHNVLAEEDAKNLHHDYYHAPQSKRIIRMMTWSAPRGERIIQDRQTWYFPRGFSINISLWKNEMVLRALQKWGQNPNKVLQLGTQSVRIESFNVSTRNVLPSRTNQFVVTSLSPILVHKTLDHMNQRNRQTQFKRYLLPNDPEFSSFLVKNLSSKWNIWHDAETPLPLFSLHTLSWKPYVNWYLPGKMLVQGAYGDFLIQTPSLELMNMIQTVGLGVQNAQGFGMVQVK